MHLAAQYLRVVSLFFPDGDKRFFGLKEFLSPLPIGRRLPPLPHPPPFPSFSGDTIRAPSVHLLSQITSVSTPPPPAPSFCLPPPPLFFYTKALLKPFFSRVEGSRCFGFFPTEALTSLLRRQNKKSSPALCKRDALLRAARPGAAVL